MTKQPHEIKLEVGQVWRTRGGDLVNICAHKESGIVRSENAITGAKWLFPAEATRPEDRHAFMSESTEDLVELVYTVTKPRPADGEYSYRAAFDTFDSMYG